jgi:hypothetical protein
VGRAQSAIDHGPGDFSPRDSSPRDSSPRDSNPVNPNPTTPNNSRDQHTMEDRMAQQLVVQMKAWDRGKEVVIGVGGREAVGEEAESEQAKLQRILQFSDEYPGRLLPAVHGARSKPSRTSQLADPIRRGARGQGGPSSPDNAPTWRGLFEGQGREQGGQGGQGQWRATGSKSKALFLDEAQIGALLLPDAPIGGVLVDGEGESARPPQPTR